MPIKEKTILMDGLSVDRALIRIAHQVLEKNSDEEDARMEMESALKKVMQSMMMDNFELYKAFFDDPEFRKSMLDYIFNQTYDPKKK